MSFYSAAHMDKHVAVQVASAALGLRLENPSQNRTQCTQHHFRRAMAGIVSGKASKDPPVAFAVGGLRTLGNIIEGFLEVLTRVLFDRPEALPRLLDSPATETVFLDRWLAIASRT